MAWMLQRQFRKSEDGKKLYRYYSVVEPFFEDGKNKKRVLFRLGELDDDQAAQVKLTLKIKTHPDRGLFGLEDVAAQECRDYLDVAFVLEFIRELGISNLLPGSQGLVSPSDALTILLVHRLLCPGSKLSATRWLKQNTLCELLNSRSVATTTDEIEVQHLYRALGPIEDSKKALEEHLYSYLLKNGSDMKHIFYDMSSSYFEGAEVERAAFNLHSKDHRPDCLQVELGLLVNGEGLPFAWDIFAGNQGESPTMIRQVDTLKKRFGLPSTLLVFDRGFLSEKNLRYIEENGYHYLTALDRPQVETLIDAFLFPFVKALDESSVETKLKESSSQWSSYDENKYFFKALPVNLNGSTVALSFDVARFRKSRFERGLKIDRFKTWVEKHNQWLSEFKKDANRAAITNDAEDELKRLGLKDHIDFELHEYSNETQIFIQRKNNPYPSQGHTRSVKTVKIVFKANLFKKTDGIFALISSPKAELTSEQMILHYREKNKIEEAFRGLKSLLELRPWFVYKEEHVRAHYTICVLAYFIKKMIDKKLGQAGLKSQACSGLSTERLLQELKPTRLVTLTLGERLKKRALTKTSDAVREYLRALGMSHLLELPKHLK